MMSLSVITPTLQTRNLRHREVEKLLSGPNGQGLSPGNLVPGSALNYHSIQKRRLHSALLCDE